MEHSDFIFGIQQTKIIVEVQVSPYPISKRY